MTDAKLDSVLRRTFVSGAAAKIVAAVLSLVSVSIATHHLGASAYGVVAVVAGLATLFGFMDFGLGATLVTRLSSAFSSQDERSARAAVTNSALTLTLVGSLIVVVGSLTVLILPEHLLFKADGVQSATIRNAVIAYVVITGLTLPANVGPRIAVALQRGTLLGIVSCGTGIITLLLVSIAAAAQLDLIVFVAAFVGVPAAGNVWLSLYLMKTRPDYARPGRGLASRSQVLELLKQGSPFLVIGLAEAAAYQTDVLVIAYVLGAASAAITGVMTRLFTALTLMFVSGLQQQWASVAHAAARGDGDWIRTTYRRTLLTATPLYAFVSAIAVLAGPALIPLVFGPSIDPSGWTILAFSIWNVYNFVILQTSFLLNGLGKVWVQAVPTFVMALINLPLSIGLAHGLGITGPLYASLIAHGICAGWVMVLAAVRALRRQTWATKPSPDGAVG